MIPGFSFLELNLFAVAVIAVVIVGFIKRSLFSQLSTRITILILASGLITFFLIPFSNRFTTTIENVWILLGTHVLIIIGVAVVLGLVAALFVRLPLHQFKDAIASLEQSNYKVRLQPMGIREFDETFAKFNNLVERLKREEKLRKDLVSDTSHELNTPLATMIGQLTAIQEGKYPMTEERVVLLKEQAERLAELVRQLDTYTKARMPDTNQAEDIPLKQFCQKLIHRFNLELKQRGIAAKLHVNENNILHANKGALQQILTNLIQNTLRYSEATELTITVTDHTLVFSDNGNGVPPDSLPYLFERFYRVDKSRSRNTGGLGLGLAIVHELAEGQGWHIHAKNTQPGLAFTLTFKR